MEWKSPSEKPFDEELVRFIVQLGGPVLCVGRWMKFHGWVSKLSALDGHKTFADSEVLCWAHIDPPSVDVLKSFPGHVQHLPIRQELAKVEESLGRTMAKVVLLEERVVALEGATVARGGS